MVGAVKGKSKGKEGKRPEKKGQGNPWFALRHSVFHRVNLSPHGLRRRRGSPFPDRTGCRWRSSWGRKKGAAELGDKSEDGFGFLSGFAAGKPDDPVSENKIFKKGRVVGGNPKVKIPQRFPHQPVQQIRVPEKGQEIRRASSRGGYRPGGHASQSDAFQFFVSFSFSFSTIRWAHLLMSPQPKVRIRSPGRAFFTT